MLEIYQKITELIDRGETFAVATIIRAEGSTPRGVGTKMIIMRDQTTYGTIGGGCLESAAISEALKALEEQKPRIVSYTLEEEEKGGVGMRCGGKLELSIELVQPERVLMIIGSGHIASALTRLGKLVGFKVVVLDPFASKEEFPEADLVLAKPVDSGVAEVKITSQTYVVIVTRHQYDEAALREVINSEATYIGMVGSKNRVEMAFDTLKKEGVAESSLKRVYAPIGLDIGAETPGEIATSIIAEIIKHHRGGTGRNLALYRSCSSVQ
ncbi:XdhC family protein [Candidatus Bathyarchaeota archaeon]|nr:XdhC family protein [Candidatus Bathyarchaeota archaeon]